MHKIDTHILHINCFSIFNALSLFSALISEIPQISIQDFVQQKSNLDLNDDNLANTRRYNINKFITLNETSRM